MTTLPTVRRQIVHAAEARAAAGKRRSPRARPLFGWAFAIAGVAVVAAVVVAIGQVRHATPNAPPSPSTASGGRGLAAPVLRPGQAWYYTAIEQQTTPWQPPSSTNQVTPPSTIVNASTHAVVIDGARSRNWILQTGDGRGAERALGKPRFVGSPSERALWVADGSRPELVIATGSSTTSANGFQVGDRTLRYAQLLRFPHDPQTLFKPPAANELNEIGQAFQYAPLPPAARSALVHLLAGIGGVQHLGTVRDPLGRSGVGFAITVPAGALPGAVVRHPGVPLRQRTELIFDPTTDALLATEDVLLQASPVHGIGVGYPISWTAFVGSRAEPASRVPKAPLLPCQQGSVQLEADPQPVSGQTGEHAYLFELTNQYGNSACTLDGYPNVSLSHDGRPLHFVYRRGGGRYVTARKPTTVTLKPFGHAYFVVAKYRCDGRIASAATVMYISRIGLGGAAEVELAANHITGIDYCARYPGDQKVDPGNYVTVSPIEPTPAATLAAAP